MLIFAVIFAVFILSSFDVCWFPGETADKGFVFASNWTEHLHSSEEFTVYYQTAAFYEGRNWLTEDNLPEYSVDSIMIGNHSYALAEPATAALLLALLRHCQDHLGNGFLGSLTHDRDDLLHVFKCSLGSQNISPAKPESNHRKLDSPTVCVHHNGLFLFQASLSPTHCHPADAFHHSVSPILEGTCQFENPVVKRTVLRSNRILLQRIRNHGALLSVLPLQSRYHQKKQRSIQHNPRSAAKPHTISRLEPICNRQSHLNSQTTRASLNKLPNTLHNNKRYLAKHRRPNGFTVLADRRIFRVTHTARGLRKLLLVQNKRKKRNRTFRLDHNCLLAFHIPYKLRGRCRKRLLGRRMGKHSPIHACTLDTAYHLRIGNLRQDSPYQKPHSRLHRHRL